MSCPSCRHANAAGSSFCSSCGAALAADGGGGAASPSGWDLATAGMHQAAAPVDPTHFEKRDHAGWFRRLSALLLDTLLQLVLVAIAGIAYYAMDPEGVETLLEQVEDAGSVAQFDPSTTAGQVSLVVYALMAVWDWAWVRSRHMGKPGQIAMGFRVVTVGGERLSSARSAGRAASRLLYSVPFVEGIAVITSAFTIGLSARRQGVHDLIAGSACVLRSALDERGIAVPASSAADGATSASTTSDSGSPSPRPATPPLPGEHGPFV